MYKQIKKQIADKRLIGITREGIEKRIRFKIDKVLGLRGMSIQEVKIQLKNSEDKYTSVFASIEDLDKDRIILLEEENIIDEMLSKINDAIDDLNEIEHKVFRAMYLRGMTQQEIADSEGYSLDRIKQISRDINSKMN